MYVLIRIQEIRVGFLIYLHIYLFIFLNPASFDLPGEEPLNTHRRKGAWLGDSLRELPQLIYGDQIKRRAPDVSAI